MTEQITPSKGTPRRFSAIAARVDTAAQGMPRANASPLTAATPMRTPVKEPGPAATASTSISVRAVWLLRSMSCTMGIKVWLWVSRVFTPASARMSPSCVIAQDAGPAELSIANIFMSSLIS